MKGFYTYLFLSFSPLLLFSQSVKLDSLYKVLKTQLTDTDRAEALNDLAFALYTNKPDSTILLGRQALTLSEKNNWIEGEANSYNNIGIGFCTKADYLSGLDAFQKELNVLEGHENKAREAAVYGNMGNVYRELGDYPKALDYLLKALKIGEETKNKYRQANNLSNIGIIYKEQGNFSKALDYYKEAFKLAGETANKQLQLNNLNNMGNAYDGLLDHDKALDCYKQALKLAEESGNKQVEASNLGNIGSIYREEGDYAPAEGYYQQALKIAEEMGDKRLQASEYGNIGILYTRTKKYEEAEKYLKQAIAIDSSLGNKNKLRDFELAICALYDSTGRYKQAYTWYKKATALKDTLFNMDRDKALTRKELTYEYEKKDAQQKAEQEKKDAIEQADQRREKIIVWAVSGGMLLALFFSVIIFRSLRITRKQKTFIEIKNKETEKQKAIIEQQKNLVEEKNKEIVDSITYAKRLQDAILPPIPLIKKALPESFLLYKPKDIVAGDFYWMERAGDNIFIAAADCTGHGVPGAMVSVVCSNALNRTVKEFKITEPGRILDKVRELVLETFEKSESNVQDGMDISLCCINTKSKETQWSGAYNSLWYIHNEEIQEVPADKQPIGRVDKPLPFNTHNLNLHQGDTLYLFTDGYADQFGGEKGKKFKYKQLQELLITNCKLPMEQQKQVLEQAFEGWKGKLEQVDDVLIIGIRV